MKKLKIGIVPHFATRPKPKTSGYSYRLYLLANELINRGHDVTFLCPRKPISRAKYIKTLRSTSDIGWETQILNIANALEHANKFDIINFQTDHLALPFSNLVSTPLVHTIIYAHIVDSAKYILTEKKNQNFIAISKNIKRSYPKLNWAGIAYNSLDLKDFPFTKKSDDYILCLTRIAYEKGPHIAIDIAEQSKNKLILAGGFRDPSYFNEYIAPRLKKSKFTKYIGKVNFIQKIKLFGKAKAFIHPVLHNEGFGNTLIESMACGTPVIGFNRGSIPEIIKDNQTGFIVNNADEMIEAIKNVNNINREKCRQRVEKKFSVPIMTASYEKAFYKILNK